MNQYLIRFCYDGWCQGHIDEQEVCLVYAKDFKMACTKISKKYSNSRGYENLTIL